MTPDRLVDYIPTVLAEIYPQQLTEHSGDAISICQWLNLFSRQQKKTDSGCRNPLWPQPPQIFPGDYSLGQGPQVPQIHLPNSAPVRFCNYPGHNSHGHILPLLTNCQNVSGHVIASNGELAFSRTDFQLTGPFNFHWQRFYRQNFEGDNDSGSDLNSGWRHTLCESLQLPEPGNGPAQKILLNTAEGRTIAFDLPAIGDASFNRSERLYLFRQSLHSYRIGAFDQPDKIFRADGAGRSAPLCEIRDNFGNTLTVDYCDGQPAKIVTSWGRTLEFGYTDGRLTQILGAQAGADSPPLCVYKYDENDLLCEVASELNQEWYAYQHSQLSSLGGNTAERKNTSGRLDFEYDKIGRCCLIREDLLEHQLRWQAASRSCSLSCGDQHEIHWRFDTQGNLIRTTQQGRETRALYDRYRNLCLQVDADNRRTMLRHDEFGRLLRRTQDNTHQRFIYDRQGRLLAAGLMAAEEAVHGWKFSYAETHLPTTITDPEGHPWRCEYDERGQLRQLIDPADGRTLLHWDAQSQLRELKRGDHVYRWTHDHRGRTTSCEGTALPPRRWHYSDTGSLCGAEIGGSIIAISLDDKGRPCQLDSHLESQPETQAATETGTLLQWQYDDRDLIRHICFSSGNSWDLDYTPHGQLSALHTAENTFSWQYDLFGQLEQFTRASQRSREWQYDVCGRVSEYRDDDNHWYLQYSKRGTLEQIRNNNGQHCNFHFDHFGRLAQATNEGCSQRFHYDARNLLIAEHHDIRVDNRSESLSINHDYDARGWLRASGSDCINITFTFAASGALYGVDANGKVVLRTERDGEREIWNLGNSALEKLYAAGSLISASLAEQFNWQADIKRWTPIEAGLLFLSKSAAARKEDIRGNIVTEIRTGDRAELKYEYQFDGWGLLQSAECGDFKTYFRYDPFGRRLGKVSTHRRSGRQRQLSSHWCALGLWSEKVQLNGRDTRSHYLYHPLAGIPLARVSSVLDSDKSTPTQLQHFIADDSGNLLALLSADLESKQTEASNLTWRRDQQAIAAEKRGPDAFRGAEGIYDSETQLLYRDWSYWHAHTAQVSPGVTERPLDAGHNRLIAVTETQLSGDTSPGKAEFAL